MKRCIFFGNEELIVNIPYEGIILCKYCNSNSLANGDPLRLWYCRDLNAFYCSGKDCMAELNEEHSESQFLKCRTSKTQATHPQLMEIVD